MTRPRSHHSPSPEFDRNFKRAGRAFGAWFLFCALLGLTLLGVTIYIILHFLAKVW